MMTQHISEMIEMRMFYWTISYSNDLILVMKLYIEAKWKTPNVIYFISKNISKTYSIKIYKKVWTNSFLLSWQITFLMTLFYHKLEWPLFWPFFYICEFTKNCMCVLFHESHFDVGFDGWCKWNVLLSWFEKEVKK